MRFRWRAANVAGRRVESELEWWEAYRDGVTAGGEDLSEPHLEFMAAGAHLHASLEAIVHGEGGGDRYADARRAASWIRDSQTARRRIAADRVSG